MPNATRGSETRRQYQLVADRVRALIASEGLAAGVRLPAERELALQLGVSRPSLREALIALEIDGRIEIRGGSGIYVTAGQQPGGTATSALGDSPAELMQARVVLESAVITLAAARVTKAGLRRVEEALDAMREDHAHGRKPVDADRRFHISIAEMGGNSVLVDMVGTLFDGRHSPLSSRMSGHVESVHTWQTALAEHEAILQALEARNPQAAAAAMCSHLIASHGRWTGDPVEAAVKAAANAA
ncbi:MULTISPECIES: FadR/GntR family transcriptional regulator [unclassified Roseateles]|uniref:FadR/GntR family transcriptional regulator n=1 Tax=unclassified Roseateles TaxID=2626991 RepID=UPI0006F72ABC|nr:MULTISPECIES: FadR/GntR family transcriptional regulator [unclassified Roseateles]KQW49770.1 GntR family transcriptional regulator [Pelomonas sp. Root405]KRA76437.1 GntR family transcriptional regulator [Pelomonas sp. Root662]